MYDPFPFLGLESSAEAWEEGIDCGRLSYWKNYKREERRNQQKEN